MLSFLNVADKQLWNGDGVLSHKLPSETFQQTTPNQRFGFLDTKTGQDASP
jgi:hypothetical protein